MGPAAFPTEAPGPVGSKLEAGVRTRLCRPWSLHARAHGAGSDTARQFPLRRHPVGVEKWSPSSGFSGKCFQWEISLPCETCFFDPLFDTVSSLKASGAVE